MWPSSGRSGLQHHVAIAWLEIRPFVQVALSYACVYRLVRHTPIIVIHQLKPYESTALALASPAVRAQPCICMRNLRERALWP